MDLNEFLLSNAKDHQEKLIAVTYLFEYQNTTLAFFSVSNDKIAAIDFPSGGRFKKQVQNLMPSGKRYRSYPAVKIGRLGVHARYQSSGFGSQLIDYIKGMFLANNRTGCQYITVDAYAQSLKFYERNGFVYFSEADSDKDTRQMYFNLLNLVA